MMERKAFIVVLMEEVAEELGSGFAMFIREHGDAAYLCAKAMELEENYCRLTLDQALPSGDKVEIELALPHAFIKATMGGAEADIRSLGFPWRTG